MRCKAAAQFARAPQFGIETGIKKGFDFVLKSQIFGR